MVVTDSGYIEDDVAGGKRLHDVDSDGGSSGS